MIDELSVKKFWENRSKKYTKIPFESVANLEEDTELLALKIQLETEKILPMLQLNQNLNVLDLGAGCGQWTFRIAPKVKKIVGVEYTEQLVKIANLEIAKRKLSNIEFVVSPAEKYDFIEKNDLIFISGLFVYLTDSQVSELLERMRTALKKNTRIFLRDGTSILPERYIINNTFSDTLSSDYSAVYRTRNEYVQLFNNIGMKLEFDGNVFDDGCPLNKYSETRLRFYSFTL